MTFDEIFPGALEGLDWGNATFMGILDLIQSSYSMGIVYIFELLFAGAEKISDVYTYLPNVGALIDFSADVASTLLIIIFLYQVFTNYVLDLDGEADYNVLQSLTNIAFALAIVNCAGEIHQIIMKLCDLLKLGLNTALMSSSVDITINNANALKNLAEQIFYIMPISNATGITFVILLLACIWAGVFQTLALVLIVKILFRGVELFLFQFLMPVFAVDLITPHKEYWKQFLQEYFKTVFGYLIQYLCLNTALFLIGDTFTVSSSLIDSDIQIIGQPLVATMLLFFAIKTPKWLQKFTYTSGVGQIGRSTAGVVGSVGQVAVGMVGKV